MKNSSHNMYFGKLFWPKIGGLFCFLYSARERENVGIEESSSHQFRPEPSPSPGFPAKVICLGPDNVNWITFEIGDFCT